MNYYHRVVYVLILLIYLTSCNRSPRNIVVIHSYESTFAAYPEYDRLIKENFDKKGIHANIRTFYLNCEHYLEKQEIERISKLLDSVSDWNPEIILVNEDQATYSLLKTDHPLLKETPVVFAGVNYPNWELIRKYPNVTGLHDKIDIIKNLEVIEELSDQKQYYTILDYTYIDRQTRAEINKQLEGTRFISNLDWHLSSDKVAKELDNGKSVLHAFTSRNLDTSNHVLQKTFEQNFLWKISKFTPKAYLQTKCDFTTITIATFATYNRYSAIYEMFGSNYNFRAGYMTPLSTQAKEEVDLAVQILHGIKPQDIPIRESKKEYIADWDVMKKEGFKYEQIPAKYHTINLPFKEQHPILWLSLIFGGSLVVFILFTWLTYLYLHEMKMRQQILYDLEDERESLALAIEGGNTFAWRIRQDMLHFKNAFWKPANMENVMLPLEDFITFVHPDYHAKFQQHWETISQPGTHTIELLCDFLGEGYQWWELRSCSTEIISGKQKTTGLLLNIEEYKKREQELIETRELAEKAELKQSFLANMSHEIRTPLNAIVGFSNILTSDTELEEEDKKLFIDTINTNSELLLKLVNDILEISRIESGYMSFEFQKHSVSTLIDEVYNTHSVIISRLEFLKETSKEHLEINVDKIRLTQVLTNFLNNAYKFTPSGYIKFGYKYYPENKQVHIYVEDSGKGIPKAEQKIIFNRFYKQDEFAQGTGLGLSISKVIIERLNGRIELWSEPGKGSRFTVVLPCELII